MGDIGGEIDPETYDAGARRLDSAYKKVRQQILAGRRPELLDQWVVYNWRDFAGPSDDDPKLKDDLYEFGI